MLSYAKSATTRPGDRLNGFKNGKTQLFNSRGGVKWAYFQKKWSVSLIFHCMLYISSEYWGGLKQLSFTWFSINHFLEKSVRLKSDHQDLLRSVCFQKLYFHCSSSSSHIFWGVFISSSLNQHWIICLNHFNLILLRHIIKRYRVKTDI